MALKTSDILHIDIEHPTAGCRLNIRTNPDKKDEVVFVTVEAGVYLIEDLKKAIKEVEEFNKEEVKAKEDPDCCGIHLP